jgi:hypothetical protein
VSVSRRFRRLAAGAAIVAGLTGGLSSFAAHAAAGTSSVVGSVFQDLNRNGVRDAGEAGFGGVYVDLLDADGQLLNATITDASGAYNFGSMADGTYQVQIEGVSWAPMSNTWTPTTTSSLYAKRTVTVAGTGNGDFGVRPIVRSTDAAAPISTSTGANGVVVKSYDDVVPARELADRLSQVSLLGAEGANTTVVFDLGDQDVTVSSVNGSAGSYSNYTATVRLTLAGWLETGDRILDHEYGHAWSKYFATIVQQDAAFTGYLQARGLTGDSRLGTSHAWDPAEMIAEDFRQLFGSATGAAPRQENGNIPAAAAVAGLRDYLSTTFRTAPAGSGTTPPPPAPAPAPAVTVSGVSMNPQVVTKSGTASFTLSAAASVTVRIVSSNGTVVKTLATAAARPAGASSYKWDRKDEAGARAKAGSYTLRITASAGGQTTDAVSSFSVS